MHPILRLYEDTYNNAAGEVHLPARARMMFVVHGSVSIAGRAYGDSEVWHGEDAMALTPGQRKIGATCWRWGSHPRACPVATLLVRAWLRVKLAAAPETIPRVNC